MFRKSLAVVMAACLFLMCQGTVWGVTSYTIEHIAGLDGGFGVAMNGAAQIVAHDRIWNGAGIIGLGSLGDGLTYAEDINDVGQVVGRSRVGSSMQAFQWASGDMTPLLTLNGGQEGYATGINASGQAVGYTDNMAAPFVVNHRATFWEAAGVAIDLGTVADDAASRALAINSYGHVAGLSLPANGSSYGHDAFLWDGTAKTVIASNLNAGELTLSAINDNDQVVGAHFSQAFVWGAGSMSSLGTLGGEYSQAEAINNYGQIVGRSALSSGPLHAFLYEDGQMYDLNDLTQDLSGWSALSIAYDTNDAGEIAGVGTYEGAANQVFLLRPVPEPATLLLLLLGIGLAWRRPE